MPPLAGRRILITRSRHQASALAASLEQMGATAILIPTIEITPPPSFDRLDHAIIHLASFDWLLFTSPNAVQAFAARRTHLRSTATPNRLAVIGSAPARAATEIGLTPDLVPPKAVAESLAATLLAKIHPGTRILLIRAAVARDHLPEALTSAGARVTIAEAYQTIIPAESITGLQHLFSHPTRYPDAITFTSSSTASNLMAILEAAALTLPPTIVRASIGPITTQTLRDIDLPPHLEAPEATIPALAEAIADYFTRA